MSDGNYEGMIRKSAKRLGWALNGCGVDWEDLWQEGRMGVAEAERSYDPSNSTPKAVYVHRCIRRAMLRFAQRQGFSVKVSRLDQMRAWRSGERVHAPRLATGERARRDGGTLPCVLDRAGYAHAAAAEQEVGAAADLHQIRKAIDGLKPRYRQVIERRYFDEWTLEAIGRELCVTRERARQLESAALQSLRGAIRARR